MREAIDLRLALRSALLPSGDVGRILAYLLEAESLAVALDDPRRMGRAAGFLSTHFRDSGAYDQAVAAAQRSLALATASGEVVLQALAHQRLGLAYQAQGEYRRAIDAFGHTVASFDGAWRHEHFGQVFLPAAYSRAWLAASHAELGTFAAGRVLGDEGLQIAEAVAHPPSLLEASWGVGLLALRQGDLPRALPRLEGAVSLCHEADFPSFFPRIAATLGAAYTLAGRVADAMALLTRALEQALAARIRHQTLCRLALGEAHRLAGRLDEAQAFAEGALALTRMHQGRGNEAYALYLLGDIAAHRAPPDVDAATPHYRQALALAEELGMRPLQAHCHHGLGTLYATAGQREQARAALATAIALYHAMDMTFWLPRPKSRWHRWKGRDGL